MKTRFWLAPIQRTDVSASTVIPEGQTEEEEIASDALPESVPSINSAVLDQLSQLQRSGTPNLVVKVIKAYLESSGDLTKMLATAMRDSDPTLLTESAHALKSSSANVGAITLANLCKRLESMGRDNRLAGAAKTQEKLQQEYRQVVAALKTRARSEVA